MSTSERGVRRVGPMAQDFYAAFKVGEDDRHITSIDEDGVALASIKALHSENARLREHVTALRAMHTRDDARFAAIERKLAALTAMGEPKKTELLTKGQLLEQRALAGRLTRRDT